jgi:hypothetical protein
VKARRIAHRLHRFRATAAASGRRRYQIFAEESVPQVAAAPSVRRPRRLAAALAAAVVFVGAASLGACYQDPEERIAQQQLLQDMTDAVNQLGMQVADLQAAVDSLGAIVAKHDTAVYRMANVTGVPYVR